MKAQLKAFLLQPVLLVCTAVFLVNQGFDRTDTYIPFISAYLDDFLTIPLSGSFILLVQRFATYRNPAYVLPLWQVVFLWVAFSVWFEWYLPQQSTDFVQSWGDLVAYGLGGVLFQLALNRPQA